MNCFRFFVIWTILFYYNTESTCQTSVSGIVSDDKNIPIIGANIYFENSYDGTSSDHKGGFIIATTLRDTQNIIISYLGYKTYSQNLILLGQSINLTINLEEESHNLDGVVITAGAFDGGSEKKREILRPMDIVTTAGATADIAGALNTLPGTQAVGESGRLFVRGGEGYETKTFIDGMQVLNFYSPSAPNTPTRSRFMPYMFSGTSFSTGGYSAEYGQALSSALILNSKFLALEDRIDISLMSVGGDVSISRSWDNSSLVAKAQYTNLSPYYSVINQSIDWVNHPTSYEGSAAYRLKISNTGILKAFTNINRSSFSLNSYDILDPYQRTLTQIDNQYDYFNVLVHEELNQGWDVKGGISYTDNIDDITLNQEEVEEKDKGLHTKLLFKKQWSRGHVLKIGGEYFYRRFTQDYLDPITEFTNIFGYRDHLSSIFAESEINVSKSFVGRVGLRAEYSSLIQSLHLVPRLSMGLKTSKHSQVSAAFGIFHQAPQNNLLMVNNSLEPEKALHYILNYEFTNNYRTFRLEVFQKDYKDLVKLTTDNQWNPQSYNNHGYGYARGIDLFWRDNSTFNNMEYWVSYSYLDSQRDYLDFPYEVTPSYLSKHNLSMVGKHFINKLRTSVGMTYTFASGRPYNDPNREDFMDQMTPNYHDLSANFSFLMKQNIILHLSATNILGRDHIYNYEFSSTQNPEGQYIGRKIGAPAKRFLFVGFFLTISKDQIINQLPNL